MSMESRINFNNGRNYKAEIFYEEEKPFLKLECDTDIKNENNGNVEVAHCTLHKIGLDEFVLLKLDGSFTRPETNEVKFNISSDSLGRVITLSKL